MTDPERRVFLDTNVLIRLHVDTAPLHTEVQHAIRTLLSRGSEIWISRQVLREYAAVLTRPQPYTEAAPSAAVAEQVAAFETVYLICDENASVTAALRELMNTIPMGGKQIHDANIVAAMITNHIRVLFTLNQADFTRFASRVELLNLSALTETNDL